MPNAYELLKIKSLKSTSSLTTLYEFILMKQIVLLLFGLIFFVAYPQKKNEYGLKMVKSITVNEGRYTTKTVFEYDKDNHTTKAELFTKSNNESDKYKVIERYVLENGKLVYYEDYGQGNGIERSNNKYVLNDKGHLIQRIQTFPAEKGKH